MTDLTRSNGEAARAQLVELITAALDDPEAPMWAKLDGPTSPAWEGNGPLPDGAAPLIGWLLAHSPRPPDVTRVVDDVQVAYLAATAQIARGSR